MSAITPEASALANVAVIDRLLTFGEAFANKVAVSKISNKLRIFMVASPVRTAAESTWAFQVLGSPETRVLIHRVQIFAHNLAGRVDAIRSGSRRSWEVEAGEGRSHHEKCMFYTISADVDANDLSKSIDVIGLRQNGSRNRSIEAEALTRVRASEAMLDP